jgi:type IV pilus assembly protein PilA
MKTNLARIKQKGFTLIELIVVMAIIAVLAVIGLPAVQSLQMEGRAPEVAKVAQGAMVKLKNNREGGGDWSTAVTQELASILSSDSRVAIIGARPNQTVQHNLGGGTTGLISFAPGTVVAANDSGKLTFVNVQGDACPILTNSLQKFAATLSVNATSVKAFGGVYQGSVTQTSCTPGEVNTIIVQFM